MNTRIIPCPACGGDKGHHDFSGHWHPCVACDATGDAEIELEPVTLEDLHDCSTIPGAICDICGKVWP